MEDSAKLLFPWGWGRFILLEEIADDEYVSKSLINTGILDSEENVGGLCKGTILRYIDALQTGEEVPPVKLFKSKGKYHPVDAIDGRCLVSAYAYLGMPVLAVVVDHRDMDVPTYERKRLRMN